MDILNLHFSQIDTNKPDQSKTVIRTFLYAETNLPSQLIDDLTDLIFLSYQQGESTGYAEGSDFAAGNFDDYEDYD